MLDLIIPCYNPSLHWEQTLIRNFLQLTTTYFDNKKNAINLTVVNDGSNRNFDLSQINNLKKTIPCLQIITYSRNMGKGYAIREGIKAATDPYCIYTDYDFPFGINSIWNIFLHLQKGADIVCGTRSKDDYFKLMPFKRKIISKSLRGFNKHILSLGISDTQAGIKGFNKYGRELFLKTTTNRFLFDLEFILLANKVKNIDVRSVAVNPGADIKFSDFTLKVMAQEFRNLIKILLIQRHEKQTKQNFAWD